MWVIMSGLPGAGKSTIARELIKRIPAVVIDKDQVRAALFAAPVLEYSDHQNDFVMESVYRAAAYITQHHPDYHVILDGRTFVTDAQRAVAIAAAEAAGADYCIIQVLASAESVSRRLAHAKESGDHPATDRDMTLYQRVLANVQPIQQPHLTLDTDQLSLDACAQQAAAYILSGGR